MRTAILLSIFMFTFSQTIFASNLSADDYRVFCGYEDALKDPKIAKLSASKQWLKVAKMAKMKKSALQTAVKNAQAVGDSCAAIGKKMSAQYEQAIKKVLPGRVQWAQLDVSDPAHIVAGVRWVGGDKKKLVEEATLLAVKMHETAQFSKTLALRAVVPGEKAGSENPRIWYEATMASERAKNIDPKRIKDFANSRYSRLFDGVKCAKAVAAPTVLGYRRGPCAGKSM